MNQKMTKVLLIQGLICYTVVLSSIDINLNELNNLQFAKDMNISEQLANVNTTVVMDDAKRLLQEKCLKVSGSEESYNEIEKSGIELAQCVSTIVNMSVIQEEIEKARPVGELDSVFNKYCDKRSVALECVGVFNKKLENCLDDEEKQSNDVFMKIITSLLNFICYKGGDQIALFIAEKGPECFDEKKEAIGICMNKTFSSYIPQNGTTSLESLPKFVMGPKQCSDMDDLKLCVVNELSGCSEITPANIVESMFRFIRNETNCPERQTKNSSTRAVSEITFLAAIFIFCYSLLLKQFSR